MVLEALEGFFDFFRNIWKLLDGHRNCWKLLNCSRSISKLLNCFKISWELPN